MSDPLIAWKLLRSGNERFFMPMRDSRGAVIDEHPIAAVFRCADGAVASGSVFGRRWGSLIDISTWGHVLDKAVIASLEYAVETYEVPLVVVLGHHDCGAMRAAMRAWNDAEIPDGAMRSVVEHALGSIVRRGATADSVEAITSAHIVETGLAVLERSPLIARRVDAGKCGIVCATVDSATGEIVAHATVGSVGEADDALLECV